MQFLNGKISSINAAALLLGAAGLLSRFLGMFRNRLLAEHFGASRQLDIYFVAFQIPDFFYILFLLGASSAAIIPVFLSLQEEHPDEAGSFITDLLRIFFTVAVVLAMIVVIGAPWLVRGIAPGFTPLEQAQVVELTRIMMLSPILLGLSSILSAVLQSFRRFLAYALSSIFYNIGIIAGILFFLPRFGLVGLAFGVVLGAVLHFLIQAPAFWNLGFSFLRPSITGADESNASGRAIKTILKISFPRFLVMSLNQITTVVLIAFASHLQKGSISIFQYAYDLYYVPIGVFGVNFGIAAFPALSEYFTQQRMRDFYAVLVETIHSILFWVLPTAALFYVLRAHLVRVIYGSRQLSWDSTRLIAAAVGIFAFAIIVESLEAVLTRAFYAMHKTKKPLIINLIASILTISIAVVLLMSMNAPSPAMQVVFQFLRISDLGERQVLSLVLALVIGNFINIFALLISLMREVRGKLPPPSPLLGKAGEHQGIFPLLTKEGSGEVGKRIHPIGEVLKLLIAALAAGLAAYEMLRMLNPLIGLTTVVEVLMQGVLAFIAGAIVYALILFVWQNPEMERLITILKQKMLKPSVLPEEVE